MYVYCSAHKKIRIYAIVVKDCCQATTQPGEGDKKFGAKMFLTPSIGSSDLQHTVCGFIYFYVFKKNWKFIQSRIISKLLSLGRVLYVWMLLAGNILFQDVKICFARCHDVTSCENTRGKQGWWKNRIVRYCANRRGAKTVQDDNVGQQLTRHLDFQGSTRE